MTFSKSGKQRRAEIMQHRRERAERHAQLDVSALPAQLPEGAVMADPQALQHNHIFSPLPLFYVDKPFTCKDCGAEQIWTAKQQKWWYEVVKGNIETTAIRCRPCRKLEQVRKAEARRIHLEGLARKHENNNRVPRTLG